MMDDYSYKMSFGKEIISSKYTLEGTLTIEGLGSALSFQRERSYGGIQ